MKNQSRTLLFWTIAVVIVAGLISWYAIRSGELPAQAADSSEAPVSPPQSVVVDDPELAAISVAPITLPHYEPTMPPGEHRDVVMANCVLCHSLRLVTHQPSFPRAQWEATVQKMIDVYGAPIAEENKAKAVDYLVSIRGTAPDASK